jgi:6-phosphogluconolactonase
MTALRTFKAALAALALLLAGGATASAATMVYVSNADSKEIFVLTLDNNNGGLTLIDKVAVTGTVMPMAVSPNRRFLYAGLRSEPFSVTSFGIDQATGRLEFLATVPLPDNMAYLATDKIGRFLLGASYTGDKISINPIGPQGWAQAESVQVVQTRKNAHAIMTDPSNNYLFASNLGGDVILQFKFDAATGQVTPNMPAYVETKKGAGPRHFVFHPNYRFVYGTNELDGTVNLYRFYGASGTLSLVGATSVVPEDLKDAPATADLHITPNGRFLYVSERTTNSIVGFRIDGATGALSPIGAVPTETQPRGFNIDPRGRYLLAVGQKSNGLTAYEINLASGALTPLKQYSMGKNPNWVEIVDIP